MPESKKVCLVVGVGPGNGAAYARRFDKEGYSLALLARSSDYTRQLEKELKSSRSYVCDVSDPIAIKRTCLQIQEELGTVDVLIYNAGSGSWGNIENVDYEGFQKSWEVNALGLFVFTQTLLPAMKNKENVSIIITGATASLRGKPDTICFASAKAAQKSLVESMAKTLWPMGIHVALIIIDGVVDIERTRKKMLDKPDDFFVKPEDVAETAMWLSKQSKSAWSFSVEARPFAEKW